MCKSSMLRKLLSNTQLECDASQHAETRAVRAPQRQRRDIEKVPAQNLLRADGSGIRAIPSIESKALPPDSSYV